jgi:hypothetical protein
VGAVVLVALIGVALWWTGEPSFCARCHEMQAPVNAWTQGTHAKQSCFACHSDPGVVGYLKAHVGDGLRDVWVHFTRRPSEITSANVPPSRCLACHANPTGKTPQIPPPPDHPERTANCPDCHGDSIHPGLGLGTPQ